MYLRSTADASFWEEHWTERDERKTLKTHGGNRLFPALTARHLRRGARVLDGGCGLADKVYALQDGGFEAHGVDFAAATLVRAKRAAPDLKLAAGDIRRLPYRDGAFDGYWSVGTIEHFYEGFEQAASEMRRVLRPGGHLFLTFPAMSPLRRTKAALALYADWAPAGRGEAEALFYQFALPPSAVALALERDHGFELVGRRWRGGLSGLRQEAAWLAPLIERLADARRRPLRLLRRAADALSRPWAAHTVLLVLRKR